MGIFNSKNGLTFDGIFINLLDERFFVMNDKMKNLFRDFMNKMFENILIFGNFLVKIKYIGLNFKDIRSVINMNAISFFIIIIIFIVLGGVKAVFIGNLFDKM